MKISILLSLLTFFSSFSFADYKLVQSPKAIICFADDSQSFLLNKSRSTIKFTVEGESQGPKSIHKAKTQTDGLTFISFTTSEGTLRLDDKGDTYQFGYGESAEEAFPVRCSEDKK